MVYKLPSHTYCDEAQWSSCQFPLPHRSGSTIPNLPTQWYRSLSSLISALKIRNDCPERVTKATVECSHRLYFYKFQVSLWMLCASCLSFSVVQITNAFGLGMTITCWVQQGQPHSSAHPFSSSWDHPCLLSLSTALLTQRQLAVPDIVSSTFSWSPFCSPCCRLWSELWGPPSSPLISGCILFMLLQL